MREEVFALPTPIGKQAEWLGSAASRKVLRVGRRGSKTRFALIAGLAGHGPGWEEGQPMFPGVLQGTRENPRDVVWISQSYGNLSTVLWREEIVPRTQGVSWVKLDTVHHDVHFEGHGSLLLRSGDREAIAAVRGIGNRLAGVIVDEAAWLDLRGALLDIILPALLDNGGWLVVMSTTNAGQDGGYKDDGSPQLPSYFNVICEEIRGGKRGKDWVEFTGTAYDNPVMSKEAIDELVREYAPDSPKLKQEVFVELLTTGVGLAFPQLDQRHWTDEMVPQGKADWFAGFDWGYNHPYALPFGWRDSDGNVVIRDTLWGRQDDPDEIGRKAAQFLKGFPVRAIWSGVDTWAVKGKSIGAGHITIGAQLQQTGLPFVKAAQDTRDRNVSGVDNLRRYLAWHATPTTPEKPFPLLRFCRTDGNTRLVQQLAAMQLDPRDVENVLKVDADYAGRGGDDGYEALRRMLQAYPIVSVQPRSHPAEIPQGKSPGYDYLKHRPRERQTAEESVASWFEKAKPLNPLANRHHLPRTR